MPEHSVPRCTSLYLLSQFIFKSPNTFSHAHKNISPVHLPILSKLEQLSTRTAVFSPARFGVSGRYAFYAEGVSADTTSSERYRTTHFGMEGISTVMDLSRPLRIHWTDTPTIRKGYRPISHRIDGISAEIKLCHRKKNRIRYSLTISWGEHWDWL